MTHNDLHSADWKPNYLCPHTAKPSLTTSSLIHQRQKCLHVIDGMGTGKQAPTVNPAWSHTYALLILMKTEVIVHPKMKIVIIYTPSCHS